MNKLKQFKERHNQKLTIFFSAVVFIAAVINLVYQFEVNVTSNDECLWKEKFVSEDSIKVVFESVKVGGVAWEAGIRDGYELLEINKIPAKNTQVLQIELNKVEEGKYADYKVKKPGGEIFDTKVRVKKLISFAQVGLVLLGMIWAVIGFIVIMAKPDGQIQKLFYRIGVAFVLSFTLLLINLQLPVFLTLLIEIVWSFSACFLPFLILKFFWSFPHPMRLMEKHYVKKVLFYVPLGMFILSMLYRIFFVYIPQKNGQAFYNGFISSLLMELIFAAITGYICLFINYVRLKNREDRRPITVILFSYTLALASIFYTVFIAPAVFGTVFNSPEFYTPVILIILLPISFAYSIFRYQLMDVSVVIKNTIMYGAATISITASYFLIIYLIGQTVGSVLHTEYQGIVAGAVFIVISMVFQSTKDKFHDFLTQKFYPEQFAYQRVLMSFINDISVPRDGVGLEPILDSMKRTFVHALMLKQFGIAIRDEKHNIQGTFVLERSEGIENLHLEIHPGKLQEFIEAKQLVKKLPVIERDDFDDVFPADAEELKKENIYTIIPMVIKSQPVGLLLFGLKHSGAQFAGKDLELLNAAAGQSAISVENARLYKSESEKMKIERDLDLARKIQEGLLPRCIPSLNGLDICGQMIPAMQVGGDYFDLIPVSDSRIFIVVGDVSGKGLSASLYMTKLQTMMQLACVAGKSPKEVLVEINRRMFESMEKSWFVTMTLALFDTEKQAVSFCRAGHVPVVVSGNGAIEFHRTQGIGVGLERGPIFERTLVEQEIKLESGQVFVFFSDGITEAMNEKQELYGEEKLTEMLKTTAGRRASQIVDCLWEELKTYRGKAEQNDDMTVVVVKVTGYLQANGIS
jgi:serine phosphatase RsbU (regulator of sigma subunit)